MIHKDPITIERDTLAELIRVVHILGEILATQSVPIDAHNQSVRLLYVNKLLQGINKSLKETVQ